MPHATHKARRMRSSHVPHAPVRRVRSRFQQQALLVVSVGFTMLIIVSLYVASFKAQDPFSQISQDMPRWSLFDQDLLNRAMPVADQLGNVKQTLKRLAGAGATQAEAAVILKAKLEARAASSTPETPEPTETP